MKFNKENVQELEYNNYKKTAITKAVKINQVFEVQTQEGNMEGKPGDYLCLDNKGFPYPCEKSIFESSYKKI